MSIEGQSYVHESSAAEAPSGVVGALTTGVVHIAKDVQKGLGDGLHLVADVAGTAGDIAAVAKAFAPRKGKAARVLNAVNKSAENIEGKLNKAAQAVDPGFKFSAVRSKNVVKRVSTGQPVGTKRKRGGDDDSNPRPNIYQKVIG